MKTELEWLGQVSSTERDAVRWRFTRLHKYRYLGPLTHGDVQGYVHALETPGTNGLVLLASVSLVNMYSRSDHDLSLDRSIELIFMHYRRLFDCMLGRATLPDTKLIPADNCIGNSSMELLNWRLSKLSREELFQV